MVDASRVGPRAAAGRAEPLSAGLHEWFAEQNRPQGSAWIPSLGVLIALAWQAIAAEPGCRVLWVGRRCWPYPPALVQRSGGMQDCRLLDASVFVDPPSRAERAWAIEQAARCAAVGMVVGDGAGLAMAESRRLQLAAAGVPVLLARPPWEMGELSAARTRWRVLPRMPADGHAPAWSVELRRCKGAVPELDGGARRWIVRRDDGARVAGEIGFTWTACDVGLDAEVGDGPDRPARARPA
jgi:hypothetical protein